MTNPDFFLESRSTVADAMELAATAMGDLRKANDYAKTDGEVRAEITKAATDLAVERITQAIAKLSHARELAKRAV